MEALIAKLLTSIVEGSITYGPYATLVTYLYLSEKSERRAAQKEIESLLKAFGEEKDLINERVFKALSDTTHAVGSTGIVLNSALQTLSTVKDLLMGARSYRRLPPPAPHDDGSHE